MVKYTIEYSILCQMESVPSNIVYHLKPSKFTDVAGLSITGRNQSNLPFIIQSSSQALTY